MERYQYMVGRIKIFNYVLENEFITSTIASDLLMTSLCSASKILRKLHKQGWLSRERDIEIQGNRYVYYASSVLYSKFEDYVEVAKHRIYRDNEP